MGTSNGRYADLIYYQLRKMRRHMEVLKIMVTGAEVHGEGSFIIPGVFGFMFHDIG